jgi:hypothetical protein
LRAESKVNRGRTLQEFAREVVAPVEDKRLQSLIGQSTLTHTQTHKTHTHDTHDTHDTHKRWKIVISMRCTW